MLLRFCSVHLHDVNMYPRMIPATSQVYIDFTFSHTEDQFFFLFPFLSILIFAALTLNTHQDRVMSRTGQKSYHTKATGLAAETAIKHTADVNLKLYGSCFW